MVKRLAELVQRNCVIKHRYALIYNKRNYGYLFDLNYDPIAKKSRTYYLLNFYNDQTATPSLHFSEHRLSENLEDEIKLKRN